MANQFRFTPRVNEPHADIITAALGPDPANKFAQADLHKAVRMDVNQNYVLCADGEDIEGFVASIGQQTVNDGFSAGSVQRNKVYIVRAAAAVAIGEWVIAAAQTALGTVDYAQVRPGAGALFRWRCVSFEPGSSGAAGDLICVERQV